MALRGRAGRLLAAIAAVIVLVAAIGMAFVWWYDSVGQSRDEAFVARTVHPRYVGSKQRVAIDEGHRNFHTADGRYRPLADLLRSDGLIVIASASAFSAASLKDVSLLIIVNATGPKGHDEWNAFSQREEDALFAWVQQGGSLLLIADHMPFGGAAQSLAKRFGVEMHLRYARDDGNHYGWDNEKLLFSRRNGLLPSNPLTEGSSLSERVDSVVTFTGQSLTGPAGCLKVLPLGPQAYDWESRKRRFPAAGHSQGLACVVGKGRLVVLGEAAMFSAQKDPLGLKFGMNREGNDNKQFALNTVHWLLPPPTTSKPLEAGSREVP